MTKKILPCNTGGAFRVLGTRDSGLDASTLLACKWFLLVWISLGRAEEGDQL